MRFFFYIPQIIQITSQKLSAERNEANAEAPTGDK